MFDDMETERKVTIYDKGPMPRTETYGEYIQVRSGDIHIPKIARHRAAAAGVRALRAARAPTGGRRLSDGAAGAAVVEVLEAMTESLATLGPPGARWAPGCGA